MVSGRWFNVGVCLFWAGAMGWLFQSKILPTLRMGTPPSLAAVLEESASNDPLAAWSVHCNGRMLGVAASRTIRHRDGVTEIRSRIRLAELPLRDLLPSVVRTVFDPFEGADQQLTLSVDALSTLLVDPLGRPASLQSKLMLGETLRNWDAALGSSAVKIVLTGTVEGSTLNLEVRIPTPEGEVIRPASVPLPSGSLLTNAFAPHVRLPDLRVGQSWPTPVYSPLRSPTQPLELLFAHVEDEEIIEFDGQEIPTLVVAIRNDPGADLSGRQPPRAKSWVARDGRVLRQEIAFLSSRWILERLDPAKPAPDEMGMPLDEFVK